MKNLVLVLTGIVVGIFVSYTIFAHKPAISEPSPKEEKQEEDACLTEVEVIPKEDATADAVTDQYRVMLSRSYKEFSENDTREVANIVCTDSYDNIRWEKEVVSKYGATELEQIQEIGQREGVYYYNWSGTVTALDVKDGSELWTNSDFDGAGLISAFTDDGRIILCGYYSPIFYVCDKDGNTITLITMIQGWRWPYHIEIVNGYAEILCDNIDGQGLLRVNLEHYEWELVVY